MSKEKGKSIKKGDRVKVTDGEHAGKVGVLKHTRAATSSGVVELDNGQSVGVKLHELAAA